MFHKFNHKFNEFDYNRLRGERQTFFGNPPNPRISYYLIKDLKYFAQISDRPVCKIMPDTFFLVEIEGAGLLMAHRDHNVSCCINYYFETNDAVTYFHREKEGATAFQYPGRTTSNVYSPYQLNTVGEFTAQDHDVYLLKVDEIHSVYGPKPGTRRFITWQWRNTPYEEILANLISD